MKDKVIQIRFARSEIEKLIKEAIVREIRCIIKESRVDDEIRVVVNEAVIDVDLSVRDRVLELESRIKKLEAKK